MKWHPIDSTTRVRGWVLLYNLTWFWPEGPQRMRIGYWNNGGWWSVIHYGAMTGALAPTHYALLEEPNVPL